MLRLELRDERGARFRIVFNGRGYGMGVTAVGADGRLRSFEIREMLHAHGDEDKVFHDLAIRYEKTTGRCQTFVDGKPLRASHVSFEGLQFALGISGEGKATYSVTVKDFRCEFKP